MTAIENHDLTNRLFGACQSAGLSPGDAAFAMVQRGLEMARVLKEDGESEVLRSCAALANEVFGEAYFGDKNTVMDRLKETVI